MDPRSSPDSSLAYNIMKTKELDMPLYSMGFVFDELSAKRVSGYMVVTEKCTQPFKVLHGGVSALIAEGLASVGAHVASGYNRVAGIHLEINHHKTASAGDVIIGEAVPVSVGRTIQVWEVRLFKEAESSNSSDRSLVASSKVTLLSNMPVPENARDAGQTLRKYSKL